MNKKKKIILTSLMLTTIVIIPIISVPLVYYAKIKTNNKTLDTKKENIDYQTNIMKFTFNFINIMQDNLKISYEKEIDINSLNDYPKFNIKLKDFNLFDFKIINNNQILDELIVDLNKTIEIKIIPNNFETKIEIINDNKKYNNLSILRNIYDNKITIENKIKNLLDNNDTFEIIEENILNNVLKIKLNQEKKQNNKFLTLNYINRFDNSLFYKEQIPIEISKTNFDFNLKKSNNNEIKNNFLLVNQKKKIVNNINLDLSKNNHDIAIFPKEYLVKINSNLEEFNNKNIHVNYQFNKDNLITELNKIINTRHYQFHLRKNFVFGDNEILIIIEKIEDKNELIKQLTNQKEIIEIIKNNNNILNIEEINSFDISEFDFLVEKSIPKLKEIKENILQIIDKSFNLANQNLNQELINLKLELNNLETNKYYIEDIKEEYNYFIGEKENLSNKNSFIKFYLLNINNIFDLKQKINNKISRTQNFIKIAQEFLDTSKRKSLMSINLKLNYPLIDDVYQIGQAQEINLNININEEEKLFNIQDLKLLIETGDLEILYSFDRAGNNFTQLAKNQFDFLNNQLLIPFNKQDNQQYVIRLRINYKKQRIAINAINANGTNKWTWIQRGNDFDLTPNVKSIIKNSIDDYWLFPKGHSIILKEKILDGANQTNTNYLNNLIKQQSNMIWNTKISDQNNFKYQDALNLMLLKVFIDTNLNNSNFNWEKEKSIFTKNITENGSFIYEHHLIATKDSSTTNFKTIGGNFFETILESNLAKHYDFKVNDKIKFIFELDNTLTWNDNFYANTLPQVIRNNNGDFLSTAKQFNWRGKYPFLATYYGKFILKMFVNDKLIWNYSTHDNNQMHVLPIFVLVKENINGNKFISVYNSSSRVSLI
ncbi:hypothetical protein [Mycoplasma sp. 1018B]|uniref:hypothetical protein n=1 Tax=Mycoplasma sp. 1018B TaxID=2967302 RepID=UPI00211C5379|nr:hypothetical protein [Mycoplasma sp. 1018B]UUM19383.1 hypothetical protein NPA14_00710 [Mycoplasma sp. 1018B]